MYGSIATQRRLCLRQVSAAGNLAEAPGPDLRSNVDNCANPAVPGQYIRTQFANNLIPAARISPIAINYLKYFPQPSIGGVGQQL